MVKCVANKYPLDARRLFVGGIVRRDHDPSSPDVSVRFLGRRSADFRRVVCHAQDDGTSLSFEAAGAAVQANPSKIFQGRIGPLPLKTKLRPLIVITVSGGEKDLWRCAGGVLCANYRPSTQAASNYFSSIPGVVQVSCSSSHGHMWPQINTQAFNLWALTTLASHPKGAAGD